MKKYSLATKTYASAGPHNEEVGSKNGENYIVFITIILDLAVMYSKSFYVMVIIASIS